MKNEWNAVLADDGRVTDVVYTQQQLEVRIEKDFFVFPLKISAACCVIFRSFISSPANMLMFDMCCDTSNQQIFFFFFYMLHNKRRNKHTQKNKKLGEYIVI
jgi:hypothetical protein